MMRCQYRRVLFQPRTPENTTESVREPSTTGEKRTQFPGLNQGEITDISSCPPKEPEMKNHPRKIIFIVESQPVNNELTSNDKLGTFENGTLTIKSSKTSGRASTSKEKALEPFWNEQIREISEKLWLPTGIDSLDLDSKSSSGSSRETEVE